ncbi:hypothetical protein [Pseudoalteromonas tunicata]|uniref:Transglutaminase-like domain-containing protein n=1 Tax=Pseudoalteromonas tunicata D2 TaxID=87626 RepID=A4C9A8_9GAMM|nr:hypothetical protein [Pseudoalteromonas tunicata]ATC93677.1 hypothetical protein PTUN_a0973 [Pseudoalteromonas tunicata]AXT29506.1 hypothetical protein D1819_00805 [Pseudoalteromonas tunicata]EAR29173.1 hypothetical protein PTD2_09014 [Pseudoalteromonas tunicata D2]MDP4983539.1 hypothetical protein [Pseudoalteromonas tunicata]MDP5211888.1 hypothetical protein [Pseudoalteromonas tunicata]
MVKLIISLLLAISYGSALAAFELTEQTLENSIVYNYRWQDANDQPQSLSFELDSNVINNANRRFKRYEPNLVLNSVYQALLDKASTYNPREVKIKFKKNHNKLSYSITTKKPELTREVRLALSNTEKNAQQALLKDLSYIAFNSPWYGKSIKVDHVQFAAEAIEQITPIADAIKSQLQYHRPRDVINFTLNWVQSIPYQALEDRKTSNGSGFNPPLKVISENSGDCDSKMVLLGAILKNIYPRLSIAFIYLPEHALIGFQLPKLKSDEFTDIEGLHYLLAEPVGPALIPLAEIAPSSAQYVNTQSYYHELF